jgi:hypothetical protein
LQHSSPLFSCCSAPLWVPKSLTPHSYLYSWPQLPSGAFSHYEQTQVPFEDGSEPSSTPRTWQGSSQILDLPAQSSTQTKNEAITGGVLALLETIVICSETPRLNWQATNLRRLAAPRLFFLFRNH